MEYAAPNGKKNSCKKLSPTFLHSFWLQAAKILKKNVNPADSFPSAFWNSLKFVTLGFIIEQNLSETSSIDQK